MQSSENWSASVTADCCVTPAAAFRARTQVVVLPPVRDQHYESWLSLGMDDIIGSVGRIKTTRRSPELVLVQFYSEADGYIREFWLPPHTLRKIDKGTKV